MLWSPIEVSTERYDPLGVPVATPLLCTSSALALPCKPLRLRNLTVPFREETFLNAKGPRTTCLIRSSVFNPQQYRLVDHP